MSQYPQLIFCCKHFSCFCQNIMLCQKILRLSSIHYFIIKFANKLELQKDAINHLSDIDFKYFMNFRKIYIAEANSFLINDTTLASHNTLPFKHFKRNILERTERIVIMKTDVKNRDEKLKYNVNREPAKTSSLSSLINMNILQEKKY